MARIVARKGKKQTSYSVTVRQKGYKSVTRTFDTKGEARYCPECGKGKMVYIEGLPEALLDTS